MTCAFPQTQKLSQTIVWLPNKESLAVALWYLPVTKLFLISYCRQGSLATRYSPRLGKVCPEGHHSLGQQSFHPVELAVRREFNTIKRNSKHVWKFLPTETLLDFNLGEELRIKYTSGIQTVNFCILTPHFLVCR